MYKIVQNAQDTLLTGIYKFMKLHISSILLQLFPDKKTQLVMSRSLTNIGVVCRVVKISDEYHLAVWLDVHFHFSCLHEPLPLTSKLIFEQHILPLVYLYWHCYPFNSINLSIETIIRSFPTNCNYLSTGSFW